MISQNRIKLTKMALALSIALSAAPAFAQNTTSALEGRVARADGKPAAGAVVSIVHVESGSVSTVTADAQGHYVARGLRTGGPYTITITKDGVSEKKEGVFLNLAETANVDVTLGQSVQTVTVAGSVARSETFSRTNMGAVTNIGPSDLASGFSIQANLQDYARMDPRVSQTDKERGEMSVAGQNSRYNSLTIDGVSVNDTFGLEANGSPTARQPISIEAIQSTQVNVANYDVTQKGYTGANVNAVTKSGTNKLKGSVYYKHRNDSLSGKRFNINNNTYFDAPNFDETTKGFNLGGPLVKDTLFAFVNIEETHSSRSAPNFGPLGSTQNNVGISQSAIAAAQTVAQNTYGMDIGTSKVPAGNEFVSRETVIKLDYNINDNHRAMLRYTKTDQSEPLFPGISSSGVSLNSHWYNQTKSIDTWVGTWFADWTPEFSTEVKLSTRDYNSVPINNARLPLVGLRFSGPLPADAPSGLSTGNRFLNFGTEFSRQNNVLRNKTNDFYIGGNLSKGDHEMKFGMDYANTDIYNAFLQGVFGSYTFGCINSSASFTYSFGALNCSKATREQMEAAVLENFQRGRPSDYQAQVPVPGGSLSDAIAQFGLSDTGLFFQDVWKVNKNLTLQGGLRLDRSGVSGHPKRNDAAAAPTVAGDPATKTRQSGGFGLDNTHTIDGEQLLQPRVGFNYRFDNERPMQVRGGLGLFMGAAATVWMSNPFSNPGVATRIVGCGKLGFPACPTTDGTFSANPDTPPANLPGVTPAANVDFLDPSFKQPSIMKANLAFDTELPWYGIDFGAEYIYTKNHDAIYYEHLNLGAPTRIGPDGRELFYNAQGLDPACWTASGSTTTSAAACKGLSSRALSNLAYSNVLNAKNTDKGRAHVLTMSVGRPSRTGLGWRMSYTYTDATEVSPLTSSVSFSNFQGRSVLNPNENVEARSSYAVKNRVTATVSWNKYFYKGYKTSFGMFYEGRSGKPYSWTFNNDLNGDGSAGNDLMYIPKGPGAGDVVFYGDTATNHSNEDRFWAFVNADDDLKKSMGRVVSRNGSLAPWANSFDLRISQEVPGLFKGNKGILSLDIQNVGNLLNRRWGHINEIGFQSAGAQARSFVNFGGIDAQGRYVYNVRDKVEDLVIRQNKGESQWAVQLTAKYEF